MAKLDVQSYAKNYVNGYLKQNPKATQEQVLAAIRNELQLAKNEGIKVSQKQMAQIQANVPSAYKVATENLQANFVKQVTPQAQEAVEKLNAQAATKQTAQVATAATAKPKKFKNPNTAVDRYYDSYNKMTKDGRRRLHKRNMADAKAAFSGNEYMEYLRKNNPELYKQELEIQKQNKKISNNQIKRELKKSPEAYVSSKKQKIQKKQGLTTPTVKPKAPVATSPVATLPVATKPVAPKPVAPKPTIKLGGKWKWIAAVAAAVVGIIGLDKYTDKQSMEAIKTTGLVA